MPFTLISATQCNPEAYVSLVDDQVCLDVPAVLKLGFSAQAKVDLHSRNEGRLKRVCSSLGLRYHCIR